MARTGRPSLYTNAVADTICERIARGEALHQFAGTDGLPAERTIMQWLAAREDFAQNYARARERQADKLAAEIIEIADDTSHDTIERTNEDGSRYEVADHEWIARSRLRVDARKWAASKLAPKKYGDKIEATHTGEVGLTVKIVKFGDV